MNNVIDMRPHMLKPVPYIKNSASMTPDFKELKNGKEEFHLVMIYDEVKKHHTYHGYVEDAVYFGHAVTNLPQFMLKINRVTNDPLAFHALNYKFQGKQTPAFMTGKVRGEVYALPLRGLVDLDLFMQNTLAVKRIEVWVCLKDQKNAPSTKVWMYVGDPDYWDQGNDEVLHMEDAKYTSPYNGEYGKEFYYHSPDLLNNPEANKEMSLFDHMKDVDADAIDRYHYMC